MIFLEKKTFFFENGKNKISMISIRKRSLVIRKLYDCNNFNKPGEMAFADHLSRTLRTTILTDFRLCVTHFVERIIDGANCLFYNTDKHLTRSKCLNVPQTN